MQLTTFLSAAAAVATVSATWPQDQYKSPGAVVLNQKCDHSKPYARIINRCDYDVHIWSIAKNSIDCPKDEMVTLKKGEIYSENYQDPGAKFEKSAGEGISIKVGKDTNCYGSNLVQLEYFLENRPDKENYKGNYLDVSYVDCLGNDCPTKKEGYYLQAGSSTARTAKASADGSWCPILSCSDPISCAKMSYILPDDVQTKTCDLESSMDFYMCGSHPPSDDDDKPAPSAPPKEPAPKPIAPKPSAPKPVVSSAPVYKANVAAVTSAPEIKDAIKAPVKVKTEIVYVTAIEYVNAKRHDHAHAHARRHQQFHA